MTSKAKAPPLQMAFVSASWSPAATVVKVPPVYPPSGTPAGFWPFTRPQDCVVRLERRSRRAGQHGVAGAPGEGWPQNLRNGLIVQVRRRLAGIHGLTEGNDKCCRERDTRGTVGGNVRDDGGLSVSAPQGHQRKQHGKHLDQTIAANRERKEIHILTESSCFPAPDARRFLRPLLGKPPPSPAYSPAPVWGARGHTGVVAETAEKVPNARAGKQAGRVREAAPGSGW